mgnify:FL=1
MHLIKVGGTRVVIHILFDLVDAGQRMEHRHILRCLLQQRFVQLVAAFQAQVFFLVEKALLLDTSHVQHIQMRQLGFKGQFVEPKGELSDMQIVEAMSKLALSDMLSNADSLPLPQWQKDLLQYHVNTLGDAAYLLHIGQAYNAGRKAGTITQDMADILRDLGHEVHTVFDSAKIEQADIQAVMDGDIDGFINAYLTAAANGEIKK